MSEHTLTGIDGSNPLGFLAALGALRVLNERAPDRDPRLSWRFDGRWRPVLHWPADGPDPLDVLWDDLRARRERAPELELAYPKNGKGPRTHDLKPRPEQFSAYLRTLLAAAGDPTERAPEKREPLDFAAAYATPTATDNNGNIKPTAFHFTAGQQVFGKMVRQLRDGLERGHFAEALFGPWRYESKLPVLRWDVSGERSYALMAYDPGGQKACGVPGADWLAFQALPLFPTAPKGARIRTTGFRGRGKRFVFHWPLWTPPARTSTVRSLLDVRACLEASPAARAERGVALVLRSRVRRTDQGGYGSFGPAEAV